MTMLQKHGLEIDAKLPIGQSKLGVSSDVLTCKAVPLACP
jgi:hypothetical protein